MGLFLGAAQTCADFFEKRKNAARVLVLLLAFSLSVTTFFQNEVWRNPETLYQNILQNGGHTERISPHLGQFYLRRGEFDKEIEQSRYEINHPDSRSRILLADAHLRLALALLQARVDENDTLVLDPRTLPACQHIPEALSELEKVLEDNPGFYQAHILLAIIYRYQGNTQMEEFHQKQAENILLKQGTP